MGGSWANHHLYAAGMVAGADQRSYATELDGLLHLMDIRGGCLGRGAECAGQADDHGTGSESCYLSQSSSSIPRSVFSSRYFTITGVYNETFQSAGAPFFTAREPGTTTAFSGTSNCASAVAR